MLILNKNTKKQIEIVAYKILCDVFLLVLFLFAMLLLADGIYSGFISSRLSFTKIIFLLLFVMAGVAYFGKKIGVNYAIQNSILKSKYMIALLIFSFVLSVNSLLHFRLVDNLIISAASIFVFVYLYKVYFLEDES